MPDHKAMITSILMEEVFTKYVPVADAGMYITIKGLDPGSAVRFEEMGGYIMMGILGRALVDYAARNDTMGTLINANTKLALKCLLKPIVSAVLAAGGSMFASGVYSRSPFSVFKEGTVIYLLSDGLSVKFAAEPIA